MNVRKYGRAPYQIAVIHGGPGAPGYMAPVARELAKTFGVLEPLQASDSLEGQIRELDDQLRRFADLPAVIVGSSWGAILSLLVAARSERTVKKLILIGCAVFDAQNSARIQDERLSRLSDEGRQQYMDIQRRLATATEPDRDHLMKEWGRLLDESDMYDPISTDLEVIEIQHQVYSSVWPEFECLRDTPGALQRELSKIRQPAVVIHGEHDPHPIDGIRPFLERCLDDVRTYMLPECGHYPWIEKRARSRFFQILLSELQ